MPYDPNGTHQFLDEQLAFPQKQTSHRPAQVLPQRNYDPVELARQARHQARIEAKQRSRTATHTNIPDDGDYDDADIDGNGDVFPSQLVRSAIRYGIPPGHYVQDNAGFTVQYAPPPDRQKHAIPPRRSRAYIQQEDEDLDELETRIPQKSSQKGFRIHWLVFAGLALILMLSGWIAFTSLNNWWQEKQDDWQFGNPRTFQIDAVVGHGDSSTSPSHFQAENLKGQIIVIELPAGNPSKARSYTITTIPDNQGNPPVRLVFQDLNRDGKLDMLVEIGDPGAYLTVMLFNNGTQFVSKL